MAQTPKTILLTGIAGFIGSHTAERLLKKGYRVIGVDNLNDYYSPERKKANLAEVKQSASTDQLHFYQADVRDKQAMGTLFRDHKPSAVVHLAAMAGVRASIESPEFYYDVNLNGTLCLLEHAKEAQVDNFVFASTSSVYGNTPTVPFIETDTADKPLAPYPASKRAAEMLGHAYHHLFKLNFTALRFFTVYGPRGRPDMMAYLVLNNIFKKQPVPLYNGGQMHRDWTYVDDIVSGIVAAAETPLGYQVINLGRGEPTLLADFVKEIETLAGQNAHLDTQPMMAADIAYTYADISKARSLLGYAPQTSVKEGVRAFWTWYGQHVLKR